MAFPKLTAFLPASLLLLRLMVGAIFVDSGRRDLQSPLERAQSIERSKAFTIFLGCAEVAGGMGVALGIWPEWAAAGLILVMLGAIYEKAFVWHTGFWGAKSIGWHYELMIVTMNLVIIATHGGEWVFTK
jgi:putative oxidoreductase